MELGILIGVGVVLLWALWNLEKRISRRFEEQERQLRAFSEVIQDIRNIVSELKGRSLTSSEKEYRPYASAKRIALPEVRNWIQGQTLSLISCSYYYPNKDALIETFEYKHDHVDDSKRTEWGLTVHGFNRTDGEEEWRPYTFLAGEKECSTSSCSGTIRLIF